MSKPRRLILASTSRYRRELLDRLRLDYEAIAPNYEERPNPNLTPLALIEAHAFGKALSLCHDHPDAIIIASDQGLICDGILLGKPGGAEAAFAQLTSLSGGTHVLATAVVVVDAVTMKPQRHTDIHRMTFRDLSADEIARYVALDRPLDCAGSFKLEALGVALFERIEGDDPTAVIGLPLMRLIDMLAEHDIRPLG